MLSNFWDPPLSAGEGARLPMQSDEQLESRCHEQSARLLALWGIPELASHVTIRFSRRIHATLGRTRVDCKCIRLNPLLANTDTELLDEVLCHELAHIVVFERFGSGAKPHGAEWKNLVQQAGFVPRLRAGLVHEKAPANNRRFEHYCPICQSVRYAKRPMTRWRCSSCIDAGLEGHLLIKDVGKE